jgi:hypothetical protein
MVISSKTQTSSHRRVLVIALVVVGLGLVGFFGLRAYRTYTRFQHDASVGVVTDVEAIRGWMTLPYIARAYGVPEDTLFAALAIPKAGNERLSIKQLVAKYGRDPLMTRQTIQQVLLQHQGRARSGGAP